MSRSHHNRSRNHYSDWDLTWRRRRDDVRSGMVRGRVPSIKLTREERTMNAIRRMPLWMNTMAPQPEATATGRWLVDFPAGPITSTGPIEYTLGYVFGTPVRRNRRKACEARE